MMKCLPTKYHWQAIKNEEVVVVHLRAFSLYFMNLNTKLIFRVVKLINEFSYQCKKVFGVDLC